MTVNTTNITSGPYAGNDLLDTYDYDFTITNENQLLVYETDELGVQTTLVLNTDYTVTGVGVDGGGTVVRTAGNLPTDYVWYIKSNRTENQLTRFRSQGAFFPGIHEDAFDHLTFLVQQLRDTLGRQFALSDTIDVDGNLTISTIAIDRAGQYLAFDASGNLVISSGTGADSGLRTDLASTALGQGASLIAIRDATGVLQSLDVENAFEEQNRSYKPIVTTGTGTVYAAAYGLSAYETDRVYKVQIHTNNTGPCTMNLGPSARDVKLFNGDDLYPLAFRDGMIASLLDDGTDLILLNPYDVINWVMPSQIGNDLNITGNQNPALASLNETDVAFIDDSNDDLRTYRFDGTDWSQVGSDLNITSASPALTALDETDVAYIDNTNADLRVYRFNGATWSQVGNDLNLVTVNSGKLAALTSTDVAFIDNNSEDLRVYSFDGTDWSQVGNSLNIPGIGTVALAALNSTDVAFIDSVNQDLRVYSFDGSDWSQVGNDLFIANTSAAALTSLNSTDVAYIGSLNDDLRIYRFNGTDWFQVGSDLNISGVTTPALAVLNGTDVSFIDSTNDDLRTYRFAFYIGNGPYRPI